MTPIRVLIVDDSALARRALTSLLEDDPDIVILAQVADAFEAAQAMRVSLPDVIILDLELPRMDGLTFLGKIMAQHPIPVVVCSSHTTEGSAIAMRAIETGAREVIVKPRLDTPEARREAKRQLTEAVHSAFRAFLPERSPVLERRGATEGRSAGRDISQSAAVAPKLTADVILPAPRAGASYPEGMQPVVLIGASTGGTEALTKVLPRLGRNTPAIVIVQHMPEKFTWAFARRLDGLCAVQVVEARDGDRAVPGTVLIAPGDKHLLLHRQGRGYRVEVKDGPQVSRHRPSVDVLYRSAAVAAGPAAMGILMTGMGDDGARGLKELRDVGALTFIQDEETSIVWGMPGEAFRLGAAQKTVPLGKIAEEIANFAAGVARQ